MCDVCRHVYELDDAFIGLELCDEHRAEVKRRLVSERLARTIPLGLQHATPDDLPSTLDDWQGVNGLFLFGPVGAGKSHAAAALLKKVFSFEQTSTPTAAWMNLPTVILDTLGRISRRSNISELWDAAQEAQYLVLDDIGIETPKDWVRMRLYALIEHRLHLRKPTIVTSNLTIPQLSDRLDSPQIASRLAQMCAQVSFDNQRDRRASLQPVVK